MVTPPGEIDWKAKFQASQRESMVQGFKSKEIQGAYELAAKVPVPSNEDMKKEYADWDDMDAVSQKLAMENLLNKRRFETVSTVIDKFKPIDDWNKKVDEFVADPKVLNAHEELEGKQEEFKTFATKPSRRGMDFDDLLLAFNGDLAAHPPVHHVGSQLPVPSSGPKSPEKPADDRLTAAQGRELMKSNWKEFVEKLRAGKIKNE